MRPFALCSRLGVIALHPDMLSGHGYVMLIAFCFREDLASRGERIPAALRLEVRFVSSRVSSWKITSDAPLILERNLELSGGLSLAEEVAWRVQTGHWSVNHARVALGLAPIADDTNRALA